jgi:hypothetical protein
MGHDLASCFNYILFISYGNLEDEILVSYGNRYQMHNQHVRYETNRKKPSKYDIERLEDIHEEQ